MDTEPLNPVIADRSLGRDPATVGHLAAILLTNMQREGVAACAKHFPGHGDTLVDSHTGLPVLPHDLARLENIELPPFADCVRAGVASAMTAHVLLPALDATWPATMSPAALGLLRERLGFDGVVFTDDLEMSAVAGRFDLGEAAVRSVLAGADVVLVCHSPGRQRAVLNALTAAIRDGTILPERVAASVRRIDALCEAFVRGVAQQPRPSTTFASDEHEALRRRVERLAVTVGDDPTRYDPTATATE